MPGAAHRFAAGPRPRERHDPLPGLRRRAARPIGPARPAGPYPRGRRLSVPVAHRDRCHHVLGRAGAQLLVGREPGLLHLRRPVGRPLRRLRRHRGRWCLPGRTTDRRQRLLPRADDTEGEPVLPRSALRRRPQRHGPGRTQHRGALGPRGRPATDQPDEEPLGGAAEGRPDLLRAGRGRGPEQYADAHYVFGTHDERPANRKINGPVWTSPPRSTGASGSVPRQRPGPRVLRFADVGTVEPGPWTRVVTTSPVTK